MLKPAKTSVYKPLFSRLLIINTLLSFMPSRPVRWKNILQVNRDSAKRYPYCFLGKYTPPILKAWEGTRTHS